MKGDGVKAACPSPLHRKLKLIGFAVCSTNWQIQIVFNNSAVLTLKTNWPYTTLRGSQSIWQDAVLASKKAEMFSKRLCKELLRTVDSCYSTCDITTLCKMKKQQVEIIFLLSKNVLATQLFIPNHSSCYWLNPGPATISLFLGLLARYGLVEHEAHLVK